MVRSAAIKGDFMSGQDVADRLKAGESFDPLIMTRGEIAFAAVAALQSPNFVTELRNFSIDPAGRSQLTTAIAADPNYVTAFKSAPYAAGLAIAALIAQGRDLENAGEAVRLSAYQVQHQAWSKESVPDRDGRLALAKTISANTPIASIDEVERARQAAVGAMPLPLPADATPAAPPYPPAVVRGMAIAALALLGGAGDENTALTAPLFADPPDQSCLTMARLNLYQCLAVSKPYYEDIFCLGQHAMKDTGQCVRIAAGAPQPAVAPLPETVATKAKPSKKKHKKAG